MLTPDRPGSLHPESTHPAVRHHANAPARRSQIATDDGHGRAARDAEKLNLAVPGLQRAGGLDLSQALHNLELVGRRRGTQRESANLRPRLRSRGQSDLCCESCAQVSAGARNGIRTRTTSRSGRFKLDHPVSADVRSCPLTQVSPINVRRRIPTYPGELRLKPRLWCLISE